MFCPKCGAKAIDGAAFCQKCGAKLIDDVPTEQSASTPPASATQQLNPALANTSKKKSKLPVIIGAIAAVVVLAIVFVALNWEGKIDYVSSVKAHQPFNQSQGISLSYSEVLDSFLTSPTWMEQVEDNVHFVDIVGNTKGDPVCSMSVTIAVSILEDNTARITPESITIDSTDISEENDVTKLLLAMFSAKDEGREDISEVLAIVTGNAVVPYQEYVNELEGISFSYPSFWAVEDSASLSDENTVSAFSQQISYAGDFNSIMQVLKFPNRPDEVANLYVSDDEFATTWDTDATVYETSLIEQGGVTMRKIIYSKPSDTIDDFFWNSYLYAVGNDLYRINFVRRGEITKNLDNFFDGVMLTYTVAATAPAVSTEYPGQIVFDGVPAAIFLDEYIDSIIEQLGTPIDYNYGYGDNYCTYDGIDLAFDYEGLIYNVQMEAQHCTLDGIALNTTRDRLAGMLGYPTGQGNTTRSRRVLFEGTYYDVDVYYMTFQQFSSGIGIRIEFDNDSSTASYVYLWRL